MQSIHKSIKRGRGHTHGDPEVASSDTKTAENLANILLNTKAKI